MIFFHKVLMINRRNKMAKQFAYKKTITESMTVKGIVNEDATTITFINDEKDEVTVKIQELLDKFASQTVSLSIKTQSDEELDLEDDNINSTDNE